MDGVDSRAAFWLESPRTLQQYNIGPLSLADDS